MKRWLVLGALGAALLGAECSPAAPSTSNTASGGGPGSGGSTESGGVGSGGVTGGGGTSGEGGASTTRGTGGANSGGSSGSGGTTSSSGGVGSGGDAKATGGSVASGGNSAGGRSGTSASGGSTSNSGGAGSGGAPATGGSGGSSAGGRGGNSASGGSTSSSGGAPATGGSPGAGGTTGTPGPQGPCDIFKAGNTPCVAAHSITRSLYSTYNGPIYQVRKNSSLTNHGTGGTTQDIMPLSPGGVADSGAQDSFCSGTICTISKIYDQSENHNDLIAAPISTFCPATSGVTLMPTDPQIGKPGGGYEADATKGQITLGGKKVYGMYVTGLPNYIAVRGPNVAYRIIKTTGVAKGTQAETMYMVFDGKRYGSACCFDYGNAETLPAAGPNMTMEALYWGSDTYWGGPGDGKGGPWIAADFENGMYKGSSKSSITTATSIKGLPFVMGMLKGYTENRFVLKWGDAQQATKLNVTWDGARPAGYETKKLEGSIILGTGGDCSDGNDGTFWEGAMTAGIAADSVDDAVMANITAAGYGK